MAQDGNASAHAFVRLRVWHPLLAVAFAAVAIAMTRALTPAARESSARRWANACALLIGAQLVVGATNLLTLAPVPLQLVHLLLADAVWISLVLWAAAVLALRRDESKRKTVATGVRGFTRKPHQTKQETF